MVARTKEDILAARGVKPTLSPNLSVRSMGWGLCGHHCKFPSGCLQVSGLHASL